MGNTSIVRLKSMPPSAEQSIDTDRLKADGIRVEDVGEALKQLNGAHPVYGYVLGVRNAEPYGAEGVLVYIPFVCYTGFQYVITTTYSA